MICDAEHGSVVPEDVKTSVLAPVGAGTLIGRCLRTSHPTLRDRILIRWTPTVGAPSEEWLQGLRGLRVQEQDLVLLNFAENWPEPVVVGVVGASDPENRTNSDSRDALVHLQPGEACRIEDASGRPLLAVQLSDQGPVIRFLDPDVNIDVPGVLRLRASAIELQASSGNVQVTAAADVIVCGEAIRLN